MKFFTLLLLLSVNLQSAKANPHLGSNKNLCFLLLTGEVTTESVSSLWPKLGSALLNDSLAGPLPQEVIDILHGAVDKKKLLSDLFWTRSVRKIPPPKPGQDYPGRQELTGRSYPAYRGHALYDSADATLRLAIRVEDNTKATSRYRPLSSITVSLVDKNGNYSEAQMRSWITNLLEESNIQHRKPQDPRQGSLKPVLNISTEKGREGMKYKIDIHSLDATTEAPLTLLEKIRTSLAGAGKTTLTPLEFHQHPADPKAGDDFMTKWMTGEIPSPDSYPISDTFWDMGYEEYPTIDRDRRRR